MTHEICHFRVELPYATFGIEGQYDPVREELVVTHTAPIGRWMTGKPVYVVGKWVASKGGRIEILQISRKD